MISLWYLMTLEHSLDKIIAYVAGARKYERARRGSLTSRVSPSRAPVLSFAHYLRAPATQANKIRTIIWPRMLHHMTWN